MDPDALLERAGRGRRELKRAADALDDAPEHKAALLRRARARGVELPDEAVEWPAKRLLRRALGRGAASQVRSNPVRIDESFTCVHCGHDVPLGGARVRDHCPVCLRSRHVDVVPGDRAADCGGILDPVRLDKQGESWVIAYACRACGHPHRCRAHPDDDLVAFARTLA
ncbi:MAG: RNHCP domain-containing protein [Proteobacteria bacterium]|nr:RNHCP domain-containing protein [Pseudomonadota bacterium]MCP4915764.1 RNHCP domain-containing protein [Pseudomonadota bacterium]